MKTFEISTFFKFKELHIVLYSFATKENKMQFFKRIFGFGNTLKSQENAPKTEGSKDGVVRWSPRYIEEITRPYVASHNYLELFKSVPEVFFPIDYIASRIAGAKFVVKRVKDDSIVWNNKIINAIITQPNPLTTWREFVYSHFVYKLCTGNSFVRAAMSDALASGDKFKYCSHFWVLPADKVKIEPHRHAIPLFGVTEVEEIIDKYVLNFGFCGNLNIQPFQVWHDRDGLADYHSGSMFLKSHSRLSSQNMPISNLIAVYEARNVIYVKRGGLGFIVSRKEDETGSIALTEAEKKTLIEQNLEKYGVAGGKLPYGISDVPIDFVRTNLSIQELQPFDETLADAISIAGTFGIPAVLVPRKDQSTFSNQSTAEKSVYCSTVIPMTKQFCQELTHFLGLENGGYFLDCDFSDVDCLQNGLKEAEEVKNSVNTRCKDQFNHGLISLNDWRAAIGESMVDNPLFEKIKFDMTDEELNQINRVFNTKSGVENGRENQKPAIQDKGE